MKGDGVDWLDGDFDGDGLVGFGDFAALASNFGNDDNVQRVLVIPEPSSLVLCSGMLGLLVWRQDDSVVMSEDDS